MFFVISTYTAPTDAIAKALPAHREWVAEIYDRGIFFLSGRLAPPTGGFMMARGITRSELEALLASDPFRVHGLLDHTITELAPTRWASELSFLDEAT